MADAGAGSVIGPRPALWRLAGSFLLGVAAALAGLILGIPGGGEFIPTIWLAGFAALVIAPGWRGFAALMLGATLAAALADLSDGVFGLILLVVVIVGALAGHGALAASILHRVRTIGWRAALRDGATLAGVTIAVGFLVLFLWLPGEFARNPP